METYITIVSPTIFETINPFWAAVEKQWIMPRACHMFHVPEHKKEYEKINTWFGEISRSYGAEMDRAVVEHNFDDENITAFITKIKELMAHEVRQGNKVIVDVTSAQWNYIPASLMLIAQENRDIVKSVIYHQVSEPRYNEIPYPLIPQTEQELYNLINVEALDNIQL
jgi:hypothetical protein